MIYVRDRSPADIVRWNAASDDWDTTAATVDLRAGEDFPRLTTCYIL